MKKALLTMFCLALMGLGMAQEFHWTPNQTFENTMDGIGIVIIDGVEQFTGSLELGVFCGDDCRGTIFAEDEGDHWFYYFSMGGVSGETFTFRLFDHSINEELDVTCNNAPIPFEINGFLGDWDDPYVIVFTRNSTPSYSLVIPGYGNSSGGYYLITSPIDDVDPVTVEGMTAGDYDLYYFDQSKELEWINYKVDAFNLTSGKGYLYAHKTDVTLTFTGTPYSGDGKVALRKTGGLEFEGWNLVGNPFAQAATIDRDCYVMKEGGAEIILSHDRTVSPMQGLFVIAASDNEEMVFTPGTNSDEGSRIVLNVIKDRANTIDRAIVRFGESSQLPKFMLDPDNTKLYFERADMEYAVVHGENERELPLGFKANTNGIYTFDVEIQNMDMGYLHLIDNKTGADIDLLATPSYTFEANTTDYACRFRLVFNNVTGIEENGVDFAYFNGNNWTVSSEGEAVLQVVDMTGRLISSLVVEGIKQFDMDAVPGVYLFHLVNGNGMKSQKVIIK